VLSLVTASSSSCDDRFDFEPDLALGRRPASPALPDLVLPWMGESIRAIRAADALSKTAAAPRPVCPRSSMAALEASAIASAAVPCALAAWAYASRMAARANYVLLTPEVARLAARTAFDAGTLREKPGEGAAVARGKGKGRLGPCPTPSCYALVSPPSAGAASAFEVRRLLPTASARLGTWGSAVATVTLRPVHTHTWHPFGPCYDAPTCRAGHLDEMDGTTLSIPMALPLPLPFSPESVPFNYSSPSHSVTYRQAPRSASHMPSRTIEPLPPFLL